jgi:hypothetical protein
MFGPSRLRQLPRHAQIALLDCNYCVHLSARPPIELVQRQSFIYFNLCLINFNLIVISIDDRYIFVIRRVRLLLQRTRHRALPELLAAHSSLEELLNA